LGGAADDKKPLLTIPQNQRSLVTATKIRLIRSPQTFVTKRDIVRPCLSAEVEMARTDRTNAYRHVLCPA
jgi:hypothetical protein